ncbi:hypothetical protein L208DRAFT_1389720 [Tricholoma matsutake]|nr:hypothetical protein L208DRAFT_1389720 [Tricholoma matsutake 945]
MTVERSASKPPLITPSASPPSSRSFFSQPYRIPDKASPAKRPRLASTSNHLQSHLPSASTTLDQIDVHKAREASTLRLFDVWSSLADRYSRPLDEDDIIDITTGEFVKDRGFLRGSRNWDIGCFADDVEKDVEEDEEEDVEEEDVDELDSFANPGAVEELDGLGVDGRRVHPVTEVDPADAEDLKQFLEAEQRRRETYGSEEETEGSEEGSLSEQGLIYSRFRDSVRSEDTGASPLGRGATPEMEKENTPRRQPSVFVDSGSDDELVNWDMDETSMVYRLKKENHEDDRDSDIEFIEALRPPLPSSPRTKLKPSPKSSIKKKPASKSTSSKTYKPPWTQLETPPQSHTSSFNSSATPSDSLPPQSSSPASYSHDNSSPTEPQQGNSHLRKFDSRLQRPVASQVGRDVLALPIPRLDLAKMMQGRTASKSHRNTKPLPHHRAKKNASELASTSLIPEKVVDQGRQDRVPEPQSHTRDKPLVSKRSRSQVEVVIEQRPPFSSRTPVPDCHFKDQRPSEKEETASVTKPFEGGRVAGDSKGKGREIVVEEAQEGISEADDESDDPITILSSSPISMSTEKGKARSDSPGTEDTQSPSNSVLRSAVEEQIGVVEPAKLKYGGVAASAVSMETRKRKRVASSSSEIGTADLDGVQKSPVAVFKMRSKIAARSEEASVSHTRPDSIGSECSESTSAGEPETRHRETRKSTPITRSRSRSRSRSRPPTNRDRGSSPASSQEDFDEPHRYSNRAFSYFDPAPHSDLPYYANQPPYTPRHPPPHPYPPIADLRAQYIISQAMHQLSALVVGPWTPPTHGSIPYTPSHHHHPGPSMYSTPTQRPYPYPYVYDPNLSRATLPPDSPDVLSSPAVPDGSSGRRKSLVKRSRSRGRRVSFRVEEECVDTTETRSSPASLREREGTSRDRGRSRVPSGSEVAVHKVEGRGKEKVRANMAKTSYEPVPESEPDIPGRGRSFSRAQTPGPPIRTRSSNTRRNKSDLSNSTTGRGRRRSPGVAGRRP